MSVIDKANLQGMSVEDLLAVRATDVEAVTAYIPFPTGVYRFEVIANNIGKDEKSCIETEVKFTEVLELQNADEADEVGELPREYTERFMLEDVKNGFGIRSFITFGAGLLAAQGNPEATAAEIMEATVGATGLILVQRRSWKDDAGETRVNNKMDVTTVEWA